MSEQELPQELAADEPIAIVGIGCLFPKAPDLDRYWHNIKAGRDALDEIPSSHWSPADYFDPNPEAADMTYARRGGFLDPVAFNPLHYGIAPNTLEATDSTQLLSLVAAERALADAGYAVREKSTGGRAFDRARTSVMLGVTGTLELVIPLGARLGHPLWRKTLLEAGIPAATAEEIIQRIAAGYVPWQEQSFPGLLGNVTAGRIANRLDLGGANCVVDAACASSIGAIHMAAMELSLGRCDMAISGGVDTFNDIFMYMCFSKTPALSASGDARPFSADADGTMLGEGVGVLVLKRLADARRDGDRIHAVIKGIGASSDGAGNAIYAPCSGGQSRALRDAYRAAGVSPRSIELVEAHGTGTRVGDQVEADALNTVFGESAGDGNRAQTRSWCALGSVKSMIGHTKAAAGVAGIIKAVMALEHKVLPPSIKISRPLESLHPGRAPVYLNTATRPWIGRREHPRRAAVSAFGFGGSNFHCVLEEAAAAKAAPDWSGDLQLLAFSGADRQRLGAQLRSFLEDLDQNGTDAWGRLRLAAKQAREQFSPSDACRLTLLADKAQFEAGSLHRELDALSMRPDAVAAASRAFYGQGERTGSLALVFPGQGSQALNMLLDLSCQFPALLQRWQQADEALGAGDDGVRLSDRVYPPQVFDEEVRREQQQALRSTCSAQPALAAASLGLIDVLNSFEVRAEALAGHSFGEFVALHAAGVITAESLLQLARSRGQCMDLACERHRGGMLAVTAEADELQALLTAEALDLALANHNSPTQAVISGTSEELQRAQDLLDRQGLHSVVLNVAGAFHSPLMVEARDQFARNLQQTRFGAPATPVYSNVSAARYPQGEDEIRALLGEQITAPVRFVEMIRNMYAEGVRTFIEAGPGRVLQSLISAILDDQPHQVITLAGGGQGRGLEDLGAALAQLAAGGQALDLRCWDPEPPAISEADRFSIPVSGANHFEPKALPPMQHPLRAAAPVPQPSSRQDSKPQTPAAANTAAVDPDLIQSTLLALQKMQQETSELHRRYLENQQSAQQSIELLIRSQLQSGGTAASGLQHPETTPATTAAAARPQDPPAAMPAAAGLATPVSMTADSTPPPGGAALEAIYTIVAAKTGYPRDILTPEMSLDADLGIDSIKRVEIFSALTEEFPALAALSADEAASLDTLRQIEAHLGVTENTPRDRNAVPAAAPRMPSTLTPTTDTVIERTVISIIAGKTGYPQDALNPGMSLDEDLGIDSIKRVEILSALQDQYPELSPIEADSAGSVRTIADICSLLHTDTGPAAANPAAAASATPNAVLEVQRIIAEKTGYPAEMLDSAMHLETDLGIDSIKRVEILSALQDQFPDLPRLEADSSSALRTIGDINALLEAGKGVAPANPAAEVHRIIADKTGYPAEMLDPAMQLEADLGIDSIKRVEIFSALQETFPQFPALPAETLAGLHSIGAIIDCLEQRPPPADAVASKSIPAQRSPCCAREPQDRTAVDPGIPRGPGNLDDGLHRLVLKSTHLEPPSRRAALQLSSDAVIGVATAADSELAQALCQALERRGIFSRCIDSADPAPEAAISGLLVVSPEPATTASLAQDFALIRGYGRQLQQAALRGPALLVAVSRLNGQFGLGPGAVDEPLSAGLGGMVKTAAREWPRVHCKCIDISHAWESRQDLAEAIVAEALLDGPIEAGLTPRASVGLELVAERLPGDAANPELLQPGDLVVISGGARGISAAIASKLTRRYQPALLLLGRSPEPEPEAEWLLESNTENAIKEALHRRHNGTLAPREIQLRYQRIMANREMLQTLESLAAAGASVRYRSVDIRDAVALGQAIAAATAEHGPVRGIVHGAGIIADSLILDKTDDQFAQVLGTKCEGFMHLLEAVANRDPAFIIACSSTTARLGRRGQADYAAANECLNKLAQNAARHHPGSKVLSVNWGPWDGGMVDGRLKHIFQREGVGLIPLEAGADYLIAELQSGPAPAVELAVLGPTPAPACAALPADTPRPDAPAEAGPAGLSPCFTQTVSLESMPVLASHVIDGRAVVPVALIIEWLAHGALHACPGLRFTGLEELRIYKGITLAAGEHLDLRVLAGDNRRLTDDHHGPQEVITVELRGDDHLHARAQIHLGEHYAAVPEPCPAFEHAAYSHPPYAGNRLFHGADLQGITRIDGCDAQGISGLANPAPEPSAWLRAPLRNRWLTDPLVLDASFQMMILWSEQIYSHCSLPTAIGRLQLFAPFPQAPVAIGVRLQSHQSHKAMATIDYRDRQGHLLARIEDYECVIDISLNAGFANNILADHP